MARRLALSVSKRRDFAECEYKFYAVNIERQVRMPVDVLDAGTHAHGAVQHYINFLIQHRLPKAADRLQEAWEGFLRAHEQGLPDKHARDARRILERFARTFVLDYDIVWKPEAQLAVTYEGKRAEWFGPDVFLRAKLDLTSLKGPWARVDDWKTGYRLQSQQEVEDDVQGATYAAILRKLMPKLSDFQIRVHFLRYDIVREHQLTGVDADEAWQEWLAVSDNIQTAIESRASARQWKPRPGPYCATCPVVAHCPAAKEVEQIIILDEATAFLAAARLIALDAARADLTNKLRTWTETHGPVDVNGRVAGWWPKGGSDIDMKTVLSILERFGVPLAEALRLDRQGLPRLAKRYEGLLEAIKENETDRTTTEFRLKNAKDEE